MSDVTPAEKAAEALDDAIQYIERNQCSHEDTYRAGTIWTICSACGQKWADDEGGFQPAETPQVVVRAREALAALRAPPADAQTPVGVEALAWTGSGSLAAIGGGGEGFIYGRKSDAHPVPLYSAADMARVMGERDEAARSIRSLLVSYVHEHCSPVPAWKPLDDLCGMIDQLDNATTVTRDIKRSLEAAEKEAAALREENERLKKNDLILTYLITECASDVSSGWEEDGSAVWGHSIEWEAHPSEYAYIRDALLDAALTQGGTDGR